MPIPSCKYSRHDMNDWLPIWRDCVAQACMAEVTAALAARAATAAASEASSAFGGAVGPAVCSGAGGAVNCNTVLDMAATDRGKTSELHRQGIRPS